ncbi:hypothetical protein BV20DRAFT_1058413 [Pilatotrama ljubarskyi]|nr:hypothetical protein BV20DRAFT_1058413 [Pilatotrama ljubarskyi]
MSVYKGAIYTTVCITPGTASFDSSSLLLSYDHILIKALAAQAALGNQSENEFKGVAFVAAAAALEGSEEDSDGRVKTVQSCKDRFLTLNKEFFVVKKLQIQSGFKCNESEHLVMAPDDVWERYLEAHPGAKKWRKTPFPLYADILTLVEGTSAIREAVFRPGKDSPEEATDRDMSASPPPSPRMPQCKRAASPSFATTHWAHKHNGKLTAADSVSELVRAVGEIKDALAEPPDMPSLELSPKHRKDAILALAADAIVALTPCRKVKLIRCFRKDTSIADTYLALADDDALRAGFLEEELSELR